MSAALQTGLRQESMVDLHILKLCELIVLLANDSLTVSLALRAFFAPSSVTVYYIK